ncbi:hypothetical protein AMTR_s00019p00153200 [Amborella trichopoda]|uniref:Peptidase S8/S53 domain-containing protein n=1 Tax=Amborella trichopoda TaxID=13333 RepID=W1PHM6_AMBTC|nr:hypothetical protein AMTR_s00019p00153200 [Amborella trichopoda]
MSEYASGMARGVGPKARLVVYMVCWKAGCFDLDILAAFDRAIADGVAVISVSIGGGYVPYYLDCITLGPFAATAKRVFVASSARNDGPTGLSVTNLAPWLTTVGAGSIDRNFPADVTLGNGKTLPGVSLYSVGHLVYLGKAGGLSIALCMESGCRQGEDRGMQ